ncbi:MAG: hypothetical protein ACK4MW_02345 [Aquificaceae bacterium]
MPLERLFEEKSLIGKAGIYPFTSENLIRVGLALCTYLRLHREIPKPTMRIEELDFITLSLSVGFMAGGGDVYNGEELDANINIRLRLEEDKIKVNIEGLEDYELKMVESILFSRYNMPRAEGEKIGRIWIQKKRP